jgi:hypothetical protein
VTLLPVSQTTDFSRNFCQLEKAAKRPYSLAKVIRELNKQSLSGFELEVSQELRSAYSHTQLVGNTQQAAKAFLKSHVGCGRVANLRGRVAIFTASYPQWLCFVASLSFKDFASNFLVCVSAVSR